LRLLHISDLHFGRPYRPAAGEALLRVAPSLEPDAIVASGDFTQRARREQFAEARAFLDSLPPVPLIVTPGNHDIPWVYRLRERLFDPYRWYRRFIATELDEVVTIDGATIVTLNTTAPYRTISSGRIDPWQLDFCARSLAATEPSALRIVVAHHHFAAPPGERTPLMPRTRSALDRFAELGVSVVLGGHVHQGYVATSADVVPGHEADEAIAIVQCGSTTSTRGRGREHDRNSFNLVVLEDHRVAVTRYVLSADGSTFAGDEQRTVPLRRRHPGEARTIE
jgi:3',5'-cyclic AMP phosphodiesterase CpdA